MFSIIPPEFANQIYDLLVEYGAREEDRKMFVYHAERGGFSEWRFQGIFGFGGKFRNYSNKWYVDYYKEDQTPERDKAEKELTDKLEALRRGT